MTWTSLSPGYNTTWVCIVHIVQIDIHGLFLSLCHIFVAPTRPRFGALRAHSRRLLVAAKDKLETSGARAHEVLYDLPDLQRILFRVVGLVPICPTFYSHHHPNNLSAIFHREAFVTFGGPRKGHHPPPLQSTGCYLVPERAPA